jgi:hypothetical protein
MAEIIQFPKQLTLPFNGRGIKPWYEVDYEKHRSPSDLYRPTEDKALDNLEYQVHLMHKVGEPIFDDEQWTVYIADLKLRFKHQNMACVSTPIMAKEIAGEIGFVIDRVEAILNRLDSIMELRDIMHLPPLPAIPFHFAKKYAAVLKIREDAEKEAKKAA